MDERWVRMQELFDAALSLSSSDRVRFLDEQCAGDSELRRQVEGLLAVESNSETRFDRAVGSVAAVAASGPSKKSVGAYQVISELGHGGMGAVYLAERADRQFQKKVAIKMARFAAESEAILQRFQHERQILATFEHPNIARLVDGGETEDGLPYIVMEYVEGIDVCTFAKERGLEVRARIELFLKIAGAVQHAHQSLIIHRDLKPANILVNEAGEPKLLDFGIAKLMEPAVTGFAPQTATGMHLMTPDYASPEQVRGKAVTTATDVYSLGAVLFELLTGAKPHPIKEYTAAEIDRVVCEMPVERPSRVGAQARALAGDLDVIILKAMQKDPQRRYESVAHFADDLRRYLAGLPILARGDSPTYRLARYLQRHRVAAAAAVFVLLTLIGGIIATSWQARQARLEAQRADLRFRQVRQLANRFLFEFEEQIRKLSGSTPAREMVVNTARQYLDSLAAESSTDPELRGELAAAYVKLADVQGSPRGASLGKLEDAKQSYARAIEISGSLLSSGVREKRVFETLIRAQRMLGLLEARGGSDAANQNYLERLNESARIAKEFAEFSNRDIAALKLQSSVLRELGEFYADTGRPSLASESFHGALPLYEEVARRDTSILARRGLLLIQQRIADATTVSGELSKARGLFEANLEGWKRLAASPDAGQSEQRSLHGAYLYLSGVLGDPEVPNLGLYAEAARLVKPAVEITERLAAADPANRTAKSDLARAVAQLGRITLAIDKAAAMRHLNRATEVGRELHRAAPDDRVVRREYLGFRADLARAQSAAALRDVLKEVEAIAKPTNSIRMLRASLQRDYALASGRKDAAREALAAVEPVYRRNLESVESVWALGRYYQAAGEKEKLRQLWLDWLKQHPGSEFAQRILRELGGVF